jgi:hypothetical protein
LESLLRFAGNESGQANRTEPTSSETVGQPPQSPPAMVLSNRAPRRTAVNFAADPAPNCRRSVSESALSGAFCRVGPCSCPTRRVMRGLAHCLPSPFFIDLDGQRTSEATGSSQAASAQDEWFFEHVMSEETINSNCRRWQRLRQLVQDELVLAQCPTANRDYVRAAGWPASGKAPIKLVG